ncbi:hypothetical protein BDP81DRAFT_385405 [Colletotrichum phormii]|uniref:Uncharacterized protein n=1 Tax=Colletotrichum phormii TaxID=359342 RepID=A0AAI9ZER8_9PEZI|nr:uncharacterized protein BDP81DRAFT_385405 [Colletotrichum phormii]KAK1622903.1 hypothetical protein BDP81DRAFT_385405 [Colletotrichum phormii]
MSEAARLRLERGATIGSLEQLMGSRTVGGTVLTVFSLASFNILAASLLITWALSPLGTQSLLRMMTSRLEPRLTATNITYFDNSATSGLIGKNWVGGSNSYPRDAWFRSLTSLYIALVTSSGGIKSESVDLWGNAKVPFLRHNVPTWTKVSYDSGNTTFKIELSYIRLVCGDVVKKPDLVNSTLLSSVALETSQPTFSLTNDTWHGYPLGTTKLNEMTTWSLALDRFVDVIWTRVGGTVMEFAHRPEQRPMLLKNETGIEVGPTTLRFEAIFTEDISGPLAPLRAYCRVTEEYVESLVNCLTPAAGTSAAAKTCRVMAQRPSQQQHASEQISHLSFPGVFNLISQKLPLTIGGPADMSLYHIHDPDLRGVEFDDTANLTDINAEALGIRLSQLINTYLTLTQVSSKISRGSRGGAVTTSNLTVPAGASTLVLRFDISSSWAALGLVSSLVLLCAGILGVVCKHMAKGPDVLGYLSTVFRDSKFMDLPASSGQINSLEISTQMKDRKIQYGVTKLIKHGQPLIGVGFQEDIEPVKYATK